MNVTIVYAPYTYTKTKRGAASLHIGHTISILKNECGISHVRYIDYNSSPFFMYSNMLFELAKRKELFPIELLYVERLHLLNRLAVEELFAVPEKNCTNAIFQIESSLVKNISLVLQKVLGDIVEDIMSQPCDAILLYVSPDIAFPLTLGKFIREKNNEIPLIVLDNYTFEPATPYFAALLNGRDFLGNDIEPILAFDPLLPILKKQIPQIVDWLIIGEGYDVIRELFQSKLACFNLEGIVYTDKGECYSEKVTVSPLTARRKGTTIVKSNPVALDSLPLPDLEQMRTIFDSAEFELVRGCSYNCMFCERTRMFGDKLRSHSLEYMEKLIQHILSYQFDFYTAIDAAMNIKEAEAIRFLRMLKSKKISFPYQANLRGRHPNQELIHLLRDTGCEEIALGIETGDNSLLESMNKVQDLSILDKLTHSINGAGMKLMLFLILGFPTETFQSVNRTLDFITYLHAMTKIDLVELEFYQAGHIQSLNPANFEKYGIMWSNMENLAAIERSSYLFFSPGMYGQVSYKYGMARSEINAAIQEYSNQFSKLGIELATCHA